MDNDNNPQMDPTAVPQEEGMNPNPMGEEEQKPEGMPVDGGEEATPAPEAE